MNALPDNDSFTLPDANHVLGDAFLRELLEAIVRRTERGPGARILRSGADPHLLSTEEIDNGFLVLAYIDLTEILNIFQTVFGRKKEDEIERQQGILLAFLQRAVSQQENTICTIAAGDPKRVWVISEGSLDDIASILATAAKEYVYECPVDVQEIYGKDSLLFGFAELLEVVKQVHDRRNYVLDEFPDKDLVRTIHRMMIVTAAKRLWRTRLVGDMLRVGRSLAGVPDDSWHDVMNQRTLRELDISLDVLHNISTEDVVALGQRGPGQAVAVDECFDRIIAYHREELNLLISGYKADPKNERVRHLLDEWFGFQVISQTALGQKMACAAK